MFRNPFDNARAKIERTAAHFKELIQAERQFGSEQTLAVEYDPQPNGDTVVFGRLTRQPSPAHETIVADIVGGLRSSLDIAVVQACRVRGETDPKNLNKTYFAFAGSEMDWNGNLHRRMAAADAVIVGVVRSFKPWKEGGNALLYALSKIAANDKHVDLIAVGSRLNELTIDGLQCCRDDGLGACVQPQWPIWDRTNRAPLMTVVAPAQIKIDGPCIIKGIFVFGKVYALEGQPIIPTLNQMGDMCMEIVNAIEAAART